MSDNQAGSDKEDNKEEENNPQRTDAGEKAEGERDAEEGGRDGREGGSSPEVAGDTGTQDVGDSNTERPTEGAGREGEGEEQETSATEVLDGGEEGGAREGEEGIEETEEDKPSEKPEEEAKGEETKGEAVKEEDSEKKEGEPSEDKEGEAVKEDSEKKEGEPSEDIEGEAVKEEDSEKKGEPSEDKEGEAVKEENSEKKGEPSEDKEGEAGAEEKKEKGETTAYEGEEEEEEIVVESNISKSLSKRKTAVTMPSSFYYDFEEYACQPYVTEDSGIPPNMLELSYSLGYDSTKRANLHLITHEIALLCTGSLVTILHLKSREQKYLKCTGNGGVGAITIHPSKLYFAVGEKGIFPDLNVFEYPSLKLYRILRKGTERRYSFMNFSPDGCLLASQGGAPDYMLTLWNWRQEQITLRCKAFGTEVFRVTFSSDLEGQLTTAGSGHIKFWKMADTYTGLKLQGYLGKFGKTKLSDIEGYVELPDGKVVSGCEWGNILVWDGGLIKVQITRKNNKTCHVGHIMQILLEEGEMMTVGTDGYIRVWDFEMIDTADAVDDSGLFEMEPMNELRVGSMNVQLCSLEKAFDEANELLMWYAQDACGGIWKLDLTFSHTSQAPSKQFSFHAGPIEGADCSPLTHMLATTGQDHTVRIFDYIAQKQICEMRFPSGGTSLIWFPTKVDPNGRKIIASFADGIVRLMEVCKMSDEGSSRKNKNLCNLNLYQVLKPHNKKITAMSLNHDYTILATGSLDCTIFFSAINNDNTFDPVGFVTLESPVLKLLWSPENYQNETIMAVCENGTIIEFEAPQHLYPESDQTFLLSNLNTKEYKFQSIKSILRHEEELEAQRKIDEERKKEEERLRRIRKERGLESESEENVKEEEEKEEGEKKKKEDDWIPEYPEHPSPVMCCMYSLEQEGNFWLSMGDYDAGYLYECTFNPEKFPKKAIAKFPHRNNPITAVPVLNSDASISVMNFSHEGAQLLVGFFDGRIRIYQLPTAYSLKELGPYWELGVHDSDYGHVTNLLVSYDNNVLLSTGADANIFVFMYMSQDKIIKRISETKMMSPRDKEKSTVDDIEDPNAYSIEDAKQKAEYDKMLARAHLKKEEVRIQIALLRRDFKHLLDQNELLPENLRFSQKDFEIDPEIKVQLHRQMEEKVEEAQKKVAWISEKHSIGLEKLRSFYKDQIECERFILKAFLSNHTVRSIRLGRLPKDFYEKKQHLEVTKDRPRFDRDSLNEALKDSKKNELSEENIALSSINDHLSSCNLRGAAGERIVKSLKKVEAKKQKRAQRRAQWEQLFRVKPPDDYEDPVDVAAIKEAKENMGDYKLKTAEDYTVPDHLRMNVHRAKLHLYQLVSIIHNYSSVFNQKLIALRDEKIEILEEINCLTEQIYDIHDSMNVANEKPVPEVPELLPMECTEKQFEYTEQQLMSFKRELIKTEGTVLLGSEDKGSQILEYPKRGSIGSISFVRSLSQINIPAKSEGSSHIQGALVETTVPDVELSPLQKVFKEEEEIRRQYKRDKLLEKIESLKKNFDGKLRLLRNEKFELDVFLNYADLRQTTGFEELVLLKEFEKHENVIAGRVHGRIEEKIDMKDKIEECKQKLETKRKELEKLQEREKAIHATFIASIGEGNKFSDYLTKVFKKKIKRFKKKETEGTGEGSDESSSDESDLSDEDEDDESEMGVYDLDVCPSGCDQTLYDNTCQLREKRLDIEEENVEEKKNFETLKKDMDYLNKKAKIIQGMLETAENDLEAFQLEKQRNLNELRVVVALQLHQVQHTLNHKFPTDVSKILIFKDQQIVNLHNRIKELHLEKAEQKKSKREEHRKHIELLKDQRQFEQTITELEDTCDEMMTHKFGRIVDLEILETITAHRQNSELRSKAHLLEDNLRLVRQKKKETIDYLKKELVALTIENTDLLSQTRILLEERAQLESALNTRQKSLGKEFKSESLHAADELERLHQLCQLQAQDAMTLKQEIFLLARKGGHILPPIEPPPVPIHSVSP